MGFMNRKKMRIEVRLATVSKRIEYREILIKRMQNEINRLKEEKTRLNRGLNRCVKNINDDKKRKNKTDASVFSSDMNNCGCLFL